jgi:hypothetical protein
MIHPSFEDYLWNFRWCCELQESYRTGFIDSMGILYRSRSQLLCKERFKTLICIGYS